MSETIIKVEGLYKKFTRSLKRSMYHGLIDSMYSMIGVEPDADKLRKTEFWALKDINFEVTKGENFGLVGSNGSGKSTLLRLINGIFPPDKGKISLQGRIGALIAVGAGFHPHMTGRENIYLNGIILGLKRKEIDQLFDVIVDFSEIEEFLDAPVATYSSGMFVRLGFSIAIHCRPDIVLVDEVLAVGDAKFQRKCLDKISDMQKQGTTFFLVSHNTWNIEAMCTRALLMHKGEQLYLGNVGEVVSRYELLLQNKDNDLGLPQRKKDNLEQNYKLQFAWDNWGTREKIRVNRFYSENREGKQKNIFNADEFISFTVEVESMESIADGFLYLSFRYIVDKNNLEVNMNNPNVETMGYREKIELKKGTNRFRINYQSLELATGEYMLGFLIYDHSYNLPHYNGYYGFLSILNPLPTMIRAGKGTPLMWSKPLLDITYEN